MVKLIEDQLKLYYKEGWVDDDVRFESDGTATFTLKHPDTHTILKCSVEIPDRVLDVIYDAVRTFDKPKSSKGTLHN